jgi:dihydrolipoamide dehydrogenase
MPDQFDLVVIGSGPGGYVAAIRAAQLGMKVACVEKRPTLGGTCLNIGCIPSKALLESSELYYLAHHRFRHHGLQVGNLGLDLKQMLTRKDQVVKSLTDGVAFLFKKNKITPFQGQGRLAGPGKVSIKGAGGVTDLEGKAILLATGSETAGLDSLPFDGNAIVSSTEALAFDKVPTHLIVVGGGYIGLELGSVWSRLGAKVTVVEFLPRILPQSDAELAGLLQKSLARQGITFHLDTKVMRGSTQGGGQVIVNAQHKSEGVLFQGDKVLVATGRRPYTAGLGLDQVGIAVDERTGRVPVDEGFQTKVPGIYAIGDLIAGPMLAHKASEEGIALVERLAGQKTHVNYLTIPSVVYTAPELASVGLTEEQVKEAATEYKAGKFPFLANGRAKCLDETEGVVKVLTDARTDRLLGIHILGPRASELIAECVLAMEYGGSAEDIARTCHAHPTLSEAVAEAARAAWTRAIHV